MAYTAVDPVVAGDPVEAIWGNRVRDQILGLGSGIPLGVLHLDRGYRRLGTSYALPDNYGVVRIDHDKVGTGWALFALVEVITDDGGGTVSVEIVDMAGPTQVVEMAAPANPTTWTFQAALEIPTVAVTGVKYYAARVKGDDAAIGVSFVGGIYLAVP